MRTSLRIPVLSALALTVGALWWWAVLRLVLAPAESGAVEGAVAVGGWGLGLLPVHCVPAPLRRARRRAAGRDARVPGGAGAVTRASTPHRSDAGSGPS
ncbi:hypothetical protein L8C58_08365 [Streptomyces sp. CMAA1738]|nr:hypothetical protein [Streptomyces sp. CMAA1738]MEC4571129.1 hypothetical protein [Streptomyces sp. CMAA1738]